MAAIGTPINLKSSVYDTLAISADKYDVGYVCSNKHGKINKWSYYKPTPYPAVGFDLSTQEEMKAAFSSVNYGLTWTKFSTALNLISTVDAGTETWGYQPPTGGSSSPYRLTDFWGYDHAAVSPFNTAWGTVSGVITDVTMGIEYNPTETFLPAGISSYYWAMTFKTANGGYKTYISNSTVGNSQGYTKDGLSSSLLGTGTSLCYFYLVPTNGYNTNLYNEDNLHTYDWSGYGSIIPFPTENNRMEITYGVDEALTWELIKLSFENYLLQWQLTITNNSSSDVTITNASMIGQYGSSSSSGVVEMDYSSAINNETIASGESLVIKRSYSRDGLDSLILNISYSTGGTDVFYKELGLTL